MTRSALFISASAACIALALSAGTAQAAVIVDPIKNDAPAFISLSGGNLNIGDTGAGKVTINGGTIIEKIDVLLGQSPTGDGELVISGAGSRFTSLNFFIGREGKGSLLIEDGGEVIASGIAVAEPPVGVLDPASKGSITVTGAGSKLTVTGIGFDNDSELTIENGAEVHADHMFLSYSQNSTTTASVSDALLDISDSLFVGSSGEDALDIEAGGEVITNSTYIGGGKNGEGTISVSGQNAQLTSKERLEVGRFGKGTLNIGAGGTVSSSTSIINSQGDTSTGLVSATVTVSGENARWEADGEMSVGRTGTGTLNILTDGLVTTKGEIYVGREGGSEGTVSISGENARWEAADRMNVGNYGTGTLDIQNGGSSVTNGKTYIGLRDGSEGTVSVSGENARWEANNEANVGYSGTGTLNVQNGGAATTNGKAYIGSRNGATGTVAVSGGNARWEANGEVNVGYYGTGTLEVLSDGLVTTTGHVYTARQKGSTGTVLVSGENARLQAGTGISAGGSGTGTLTIEKGGVVSTVYSYIGLRAGSTGTASVSGAGSLLQSSRRMRVGSIGNGTLEILNGGLVTAKTTQVAYGGDSKGMLRFGIGDDGTGDIVSGLLALTGDLTLFSDRAFFDLMVDDALDLALNTEFTLITYNEVHGLFSFLDEFDVVQTLMDNSYFTTGIYTFLVDYRATAFVLTLDSILDTGPMGVPEPGPLGIIAFGLMGVGFVRMRRRR